MTVSELEEYYATRSKWYYSKNLIENYSPSRRDGISKELEAETRSDYCHFIRYLFENLKLYTITKSKKKQKESYNERDLLIPTATAIMFCHRFFMHQSLSKNDWKIIGAACVLLASKSEDAQYGLNEVVTVAFNDEIKEIPDKSIEKAFRKEKRELLELAERVVLKTIRFELNVNHAFRPLHNAMKSLKIYHNDIRKEAWGLVHSWMHTSLVVQHEPQYIAAGSLCIATRVHEFILPNNWWQHFDIVPDSLSVCIGDMVEILYIKRPDYAERLANRVQPKLPVLDSQPVSKTPVSVLGSDGTGGNAKLEAFASDTSSSEKETETKQREIKRKGKDITGQNAKLEISISGEKGYEQRITEVGKENDLVGKFDIAKIRETIIKRKMNRERSGVKLEVSRDDLDGWIEKELESGITVESKTENNKTSKTGEKIDVAKIKEALRKRKMNREIGSVKQDASSDDLEKWIEKEIESGIVVGSEPDKKRTKTSEKEEKKVVLDASSGLGNKKLRH